MKNHEIRAAIIQIQSEQIALYPEIPIEYYSLYRQHKPREPALSGHNQTLTGTAERDIFWMIGRGISRMCKAMRRAIK